MNYTREVFGGVTSRNGTCAYCKVCDLELDGWSAKHHFQVLLPQHRLDLDDACSIAAAL
jgi:hypothetical protein